MSIRKSTDFIVIHCADTYPEMDIGVAEIDKWHRQRGWNGCGYHLVIRRDGTVESGRDIDEPGAHAYGFNGRSIGICLVGGKQPQTGEELTGTALFQRPQLGALALYLDSLRHAHPEAKIVGHCELSHNKTCPNFDVPEWLALEGITNKE